MRDPVLFRSVSGLTREKVPVVYRWQIVGVFVALRDISMATLHAGSEHYHKNMVVKSGKKVQRNI